ncbi:hypothetical protein RFI_25684, partial [Reticulomyxa filosa]
TETTKLLMRYLAMTAPSTSMETSIVEEQIIAASPILEAYGNAKTVMNNNSSRFGKFTKLLYNVPEKAKQGHILGAYLETYLLEKSRVVFQANHERNYHIFYFLLKECVDKKYVCGGGEKKKGLGEEQLKNYHLTKAKDFWYTKQGGADEIVGMSDRERFEELVESMKMMRIDSEMTGLWAIAAGILNLGNVEFKREGDGFASISDGSLIKKVAELWGITDKVVLGKKNVQIALAERLTTSTMVVMKKNIIKKQTFDEVYKNRDSIAKGFYEQCFLYLCERINAELVEMDDAKNDEDEPSAKSQLFIGILDVFGFENFFVNSLEQFCINFANEKLQEFFNYHIICSEQEEYMQESLLWRPLQIPSNHLYIEMVEDQAKGFFVLLDGSCRAPQPTVEAFMQEFMKVHGNNPTVRAAKGPGGNARGTSKSTKGSTSKEKFFGFTVNHFADTVTYDAKYFLIKNNEAIHSDTAKLLAKSTNPLIQHVSQIGINERSGQKKLSVTGMFHKGIKTLMKNLKQTGMFTHFQNAILVYINKNNKQTNKQKKSRSFPTDWDEEVVEGQLRSGGLVEALKVLALGYPTRVPYRILYEKYHSSITNPLIRDMEPESFSTALLIAFDVSEDDYELGLTKIFFKPAKAAVLDTIMTQAGHPLSAEQNAKITKWVVQTRLKQMVGTAKAFLQLRHGVRLARAAKNWEHVGRVSSLLAFSLGRHLHMARKNILQRKRNESAQVIQTFFRSTFECSRHRKRIIKFKKASKMVWISYRRWNERKAFQSWLDARVAETRKQKLTTLNFTTNNKVDEQKEQQRLEEEREKLIEKELEIQRAQQEKERKRLEEAREKLSITAERIDKQKQKEKDDEAATARAEREASIKLKRNLIKEQEITRRQEDDEKHIRENFPERFKNEEDDNNESSEHKKRGQRSRNKKRTNKKQKKNEGNDDNKEKEDDEMVEENEDELPILNVKQQLPLFSKIAAIGQLFLKHTGSRRRRPQDRIVKIKFDSNAAPKQISWGGGSRHIAFEDILYIAWGHWTPAFQERKECLDPKLCFSIVGKTQILDLEAQSKEMAELWVKGLRKLIAQTNEEAEKLCEQGLQNANLGEESQSKKSKNAKNNNEQKRYPMHVIQVQQDLFLMTTMSVFRTLQEERIWDIDQSVKDRFDPKILYEEALRQDISWRQWNKWIRDMVVCYLIENNRMIALPSSAPTTNQSVLPIQYVRFFFFGFFAALLFI